MQVNEGNKSILKREQPQPTRTLEGVLDVGREAALVADVAGVETVLALNDALEVLIHLGAHFHRLLQVLGASREQHELLEGELVAGVLAAVDHVECWHRDDELALRAGAKRGKLLGDVLVEGQTGLGCTSFAHCLRNSQNRVSAQLALRVSSIELLKYPEITLMAHSSNNIQ